MFPLLVEPRRKGKGREGNILYRIIRGDGVAGVLEMQKALQDLSSPQLRRLSLRRRAAIRQHLQRAESGAHMESQRTRVLNLHGLFIFFFSFGTALRNESGR